MARKACCMTPCSDQHLRSGAVLHHCVQGGGLPFAQVFRPCRAATPQAPLRCWNFPWVAQSRCVRRSISSVDFPTLSSQRACCTESAAILEELRLECWTELTDMNALALGLIFRHPDNAQVPCFLCQGVVKPLSDHEL